MSGAKELKKLIPGIIFVTLVLILSLVIVIITKPKPLPAISNPDEVFLTVGDYTITNQELYEKLKGDIGITELIYQIDGYLLSDYIDLVDADDLEEYINEEMYGQEDWATELTLDEQAEAEEEFMDNMYLNGYYTMDDIEEYYTLQLAKELYTKEVLRENETGITEDDITDYFDENYQADVCAIDVIFLNKEEVTNALEEFGAKVVVIDNESLFAWIPVDEFGDEIPYGDENYPDEEILLTETEILQLYIDLYNYQNQFKDGLVVDVDYTVDAETGDITFDCANINEDLLFNYVDTNESNSTLANYLFYSLDNDDETEAINYTISTRMLGTYYHLVYKLDTQETEVALEDVQDEIIETLLDDQVSSNVTTKIANLRTDNNITFYDKLLDLDYMWVDYYFAGSDAYDSYLVASVDGFEINADQLFGFLKDRLGVLNAVELITAKALKDTTYYAEEITEEVIEEYRDLVLTWKTNFSQNMYASSGYSASYGWENFIYSQFRLTDENEIVNDFLTNNTVTNVYVVDSFDVSQAMMQAQLDEYFAASAEHILYFIDLDLDGEADMDNEDYTPEQEVLAHNLGQLIIDELNSKVDSTTTYAEAMAEVIDDFEAANRTDSIYADFKNAGFNMLTQTLTGSDDTAYFHNGDMVEAFNDAVKAVWDLHDADNTHGDIDQLIESYVETEFGYHIVAVTATEAAPAAEYDDDVVVRYLPTNDEIELYLDGETLDDDVTAAIAAYYSPAFAEIADSNHVQLQMMNDFILNSTYTFEATKYEDIFDEMINIINRKIAASEEE